MATINLLPWREEKREELKKQFFITLVLVVLLAVGIIFAWQSILVGALDTQKQRNQLLQSRINQLDEQVKEIGKLKKHKKELVERMKVIQSLQGNRPEIVHIFDEIVRTLPDGVYFKSLTRKGNVLTIIGAAESNNRVSSLMRQLDASEWFNAPNLKEVKASKEMGGSGNSFDLIVNIVSPADDEHKI